MSRFHGHCFSPLAQRRGRMSLWKWLWPLVAFVSLNHFLAFSLFLSLSLWTLSSLQMSNYCCIADYCLSFSSQMDTKCLPACTIYTATLFSHWILRCKLMKSRWIENWFRIFTCSHMTVSLSNLPLSLPLSSNIFFLLLLLFLSPTSPMWYWWYVWVRGLDTFTHKCTHTLITEQQLESKAVLILFLLVNGIMSFN